MFAMVPDGTGCVMLDAAYDAYENYRMIRNSGRRPVNDPRKNHTLKEVRRKWGKVLLVTDNASYSDTQKFVQNIDQHLLESITNSQKNSVFHEGFDSIIRFLNASTFYGLLTPCTNFGVYL